AHYGDRVLHCLTLGMLLVFGVPRAQSLAGREHGRTIPLAGVSSPRRKAIREPSLARRSRELVSRNGCNTPALLRIGGQRACPATAGAAAASASGAVRRPGRSS